MTKPAGVRIAVGICFVRRYIALGMRMCRAGNRICTTRSQQGKKEGKHNELPEVMGRISLHAKVSHDTSHMFVMI